MPDGSAEEDLTGPPAAMDPIPMPTPAPPHTRGSRASEIIAAGRRLLEAQGPDALTMRNLGAELGVQAPSLYKHLSGKHVIELALVDAGMSEIGRVLHDAVHSPWPHGPIASVLAAYRDYALAHPNLYRLATGSTIPRGTTTPGLEEWAGNPFFLATGDPHVAQALFSFAHGTVILELDGRFPADHDLRQTWAAGADAFTAACRARSGSPPGPRTGGER